MFSEDNPNGLYNGFYSRQIIRAIIIAICGIIAYFLFAGLGYGVTNIICIYNVTFFCDRDAWNCYNSPISWLCAGSGFIIVAGIFVIIQLIAFLKDAIQNITNEINNSLTSAKNMETYGSFTVPIPCPKDEL